MRLSRRDSPTRRSAPRGAYVLASLFALATALVGCVYPATEVIVTLDTDAPADRFMTVRALVHFSGDAGAEHLWQRGTGVPGAITLPASFAVVPGRGPLDQTVSLEIEVHVEPQVSGTAPIDFSRHAAFSLSTHRTGALGIFLPLACGASATGCTTVLAPLCTVSILCNERGLTCGNDGTCVPVRVTPAVGADAGSFRPDAVGFDAIASDAADATDVPADLTLSDSGPCDGGGVCAPGATRACTCNGTQTCTARCAWGSCATNCTGGQVCGTSGCCTSSCPGRCSYNTCTGAVCNSCPSTGRYTSASNCTMIGSVTTVCNNPSNPAHNQCDCPVPLSPCCGGGCC